MIDFKKAYEIKNIKDHKVIDKIEEKSTGKVWYEAFKQLIAEGIPPLTLTKCKEANAINYQMYGNSVQGGIPTSTTPFEIQSVGIKTENLFNNKIILMNATSSIKDIISTKTGIKFTATHTTGQINVIIGLAKNFEGKTLVFSSPNYYNTAATSFAIRTSNKTHLYGGTNWTKYGDVYYSTITVPKNGYTDEELCLRLYYAGLTSGDVVTYDDIMVTYGDAPKPYVPYGYIVPVKVNDEITNIYLDEPLRKINEYADYIDFEKQKIYRKIPSYKFIGTESFSMFTSGNVNYFRTTIISLKYIPFLSGGTNLTNNGLCNYYIVKNSGARENYTLSAGSSNLYTFDFGNNDFANATDFKNDISYKYKNGTPLEICVVGYEPIEEDILLPNLTLQKGTNIIEVDTNILPSNMIIQYYGK